MDEEVKFCHHILMKVYEYALKKLWNS